MSETSRGMRSKPTFPANLIKQMMYDSSEEVGRMRKGVPHAVSKSVELFLSDLTKEAVKLCIEQGDMKLGFEHFQKVAQTVDRFDFIASVLTQPTGSDESKTSRSSHIDTHASVSPTTTSDQLSQLEDVYTDDVELSDEAIEP